MQSVRHPQPEIILALPSSTESLARAPQEEPSLLTHTLPNSTAVVPPPNPVHHLPQVLLDATPNPSSTTHHTPNKSFHSTIASSSASGSYNMEQIPLSPSYHQTAHITPSLTYRRSSFSPSPTPSSNLPEKLSSSPYPHKLRLHQRCAKALRQEAKDCKDAALEILHFVKHHNWKQTIRNAFQRKYWGWWLLLLVIIILSSILSSYHTKVALYLKPYQAQIKSASWSWIIPTILLIIVSFPPLFGHELIILISGMIWGLWIGFAIACAGTFLGEIMTYYAFKHLIGRRSARVEAGSVTYASLAKLMRDGGLGMVILVRASAMPGHVCTAMQATIGIGVWVFTVACLVTLPKQFALVYVGMMLGDPGLDPKDPLRVQNSSKNDHDQQAHHRISAAVFLITAFFTLISAYIVWMRLRKIRPFVQQQFDARQNPTSIPSPTSTKSPQTSLEKIALPNLNLPPNPSLHTLASSHPSIAK